MRLFVLEDGSAGFALKGDDIVSLFKDPSSQSGKVADAMVKLAVDQGGRRLDAFDTVLPHLYAPHGFTVVSRMKWSDQYAPPDWDKAAFARYNNGEPDVVYMAYDPSTVGRKYQGQEEGEYVEDPGQAVSAQSAKISGDVETPTVVLHQSGKKRTRGFIEIGGQRVYISLPKDSDRSTFLHEAGHLYLTMIERMVAKGGASAQLQADLVTLRKWLGAEEGKPFTVEQQEKFAKGFEQYLMEGKAPSNELRGAFYRFKKWLTKLYQNAAEYFQGVDLSDDVRRVMDRLVATEEEIGRAMEEMSLPPMAQDLQALGFNEAQSAKIVEILSQGRQAAEEELFSKISADIKREDEKWFKEEKARISREVESEVRDESVYQAIAFMRDGKLPDGSKLPAGIEGFKLDRESVEQQFPYLVDAVPKTLMSRGKGNVSADTAARMFGFPSGEELINALINAPSQDSVINQRTYQRIQDELGGLKSEAEIKDEAMKAVHNTDMAKVIRMQLEHLLGEEFATFKKLDRKAAGRIPSTELVRAQAKEAMNDKRVRDVSAAVYQRAEKRAGKEAVEAILKGDVPAMIEAKRRQLLNFELFRAATAAREEVGKMLKEMRDLSKPAARERIGKYGPDFLEQVEGVLDRYNLRPMSLGAMSRKAKTLSEWYRQQVELGFEPEMNEDFLDETHRVDYRDLTVDEFREVYRAVKSIVHTGKKNGELLEGEREMSFDKAVGLLVERAEKSLPNKVQKIDPALKTWWDKFKEGLVDADTSMIPVETMVEMLDGGPLGPWHDLIFNRSSKAQGELLDMISSVGEKLWEKLEAYQKGNPGRLSDVIQTSFGPMSRMTLMSIGFNVMNESNYDKLIRGHGWEERQAELMRELGKLDRRDWKYMQDSVNVMESLWGRISDLHREVAGVPLEKIEARPFTIRLSDGSEMKLEGGYFPVKYNPDLSEQGRKQETGPLAGLTEEGYARATIPASHRKKRTGFAAPLLLEFPNIMQKHLVGVMKDLAYRKFLIDSNRLLKDQRVRGVLQERLGKEYEEMFLGSAARPGWLRAVANEHVVSPAAGLDFFGRIAEKARTNVTIVALGFKASSVVAQFAGFSNAYEYISDNYGAKFYTEAIKKLYADPVKNLDPNNPDGMLAQAIKESPEMRHRWKTMDRDLADVQRELRQNKYGAVKEMAARGAMYGIAFADRLVSLPTYWAGKMGSISKGASVDQAINAGEAAVRRSQGSGAAKDLSKIQRQRGAMRLFTMFLTPFMAQYGRLRAVGGNLGRKGLSYAPEAIVRSALIASIPAILSELLAGRGPGGDDKKKAGAAKWAAIKALSSFANVIPFVREVVSPLENYLTDGRLTDTRYSPVFQMTEKLGKTAWRLGEVAAGERKMTDELGWDAFESSGYALGLPTSQAAITGEYLIDLAVGEGKPKNAADFMRDLIYRRDFKEREGKK